MVSWPLCSALFCINYYFMYPYPPSLSAMPDTAVAMLSMTEHQGHELNDIIISAPDDLIVMVENLESVMSAFRTTPKAHHGGESAVHHL